MNEINKGVLLAESAQATSTDSAMKQAKRIDLIGALSLINDAAIALAQFKQQQTQNTIELNTAYETIEQLYDTIRAYEAERLRLSSALEQASSRIGEVHNRRSHIKLAQGSNF